MTRIKNLGILLLFTLWFSVAAKASDCSLLVPNNTENIISYITQLLEDKTLSTEALKKFSERLEVRDGSLNPVAFEQPSTAVLIHGQVLGAMIEQDVDWEKVQAWAHNYLDSIAKQNKTRTDTEKATASLFRPIKFIKIKGGVVKLPLNNGEFRTITVPDFEISDTKITEAQWVAVMGKNPVEHKRTNPEKLVVFKGEKVVPDAPVKNISYYSALAFANQYSADQNLPFIYGLSGRFIRGDEATGSLRIDSYHSGFDDNTEDLFKYNSYRLPTTAEYTLIYSKLMRQNITLEKHERVNGSLFRETSEVAYLAPYLIDGQKFYDFFGLNKDWLFDIVVEPHPRRPGEEREGRAVHGFDLTIRKPEQIAAALKNIVKVERPNSHFGSPGMRLVRTLK